MEPGTLMSARQWAEQTFGEVQLGDQRREQRAVTMAAAMAADPAASLPQQMGSEGQTHAAWRILQSPHVGYESLIEPPVQQTRAAMSQHRRVLLIQDPTEVDDQAHPSTTGLGPIGDGSHHGSLLQTVLAVAQVSKSHESHESHARASRGSRGSC
jgi:hypothetical protein